MIVTVKQGKGDKIHISIDGEYSMTVDAVYWYSLGISSGDEIDGEEFEALKYKVESRRAFNNALDILSRRAHSKEELRKKLRRKYSEEASRAALERVEELGYIDDEKFAEDYARQLYEVKHMAPYAISKELMLKGVDRDIVRRVVDDIEFDPQEEIRQIVEKKYAGKLNDEKQVRRAYNTLVRLGYKYSDIMNVLKEYFRHNGVENL